MGLSPDLAGHASVVDVSPTVSGVAYATMSALIAGKARDAEAAAALASPAGARGAAFRGADDDKLVPVRWAEVPEAGETASVNVTLTLPASGFERYEVTASHAPVASPTVTLTGAPSFFVER